LEIPARALALILKEGQQVQQVAEFNSYFFFEVYEK
jgi:hypothetical protein